LCIANAVEINVSFLRYKRHGTTGLEC